MHELSIVGDIASRVVRAARNNNIAKVASVQLTIGELRDLSEEWINRYFEQCTRNTVAHGADLEISWLPIRIRCSSCGGESIVKRMDLPKLDKMRCTQCSSDEVSLTSGRELIIDSICSAESGDNRRERS